MFYCYSLENDVDLLLNMKTIFDEQFYADSEYILHFYLALKFEEFMAKMLKQF